MGVKVTVGGRADGRFVVGGVVQAERKIVRVRR
jgi:hypothetical protein